MFVACATVLLATRGGEKTMKALLAEKTVFGKGRTFYSTREGLPIMNQEELTGKLLTNK